jgi:hypothetical protein
MCCNIVLIISNNNATASLIKELADEKNKFLFFRLQLKAI